MDAVRWMLEIVCPNCERRFYLHLSCYRGDKYCSDECKEEARRRKQAVNKKKYERSAKGRDRAAKRQRRRRKTQDPAKTKAHVTQQGPSRLGKPSQIVAVRAGGLADANENEPCLRCARCGQPGVLLRHLPLGP